MNDAHHGKRCGTSGTRRTSLDTLDLAAIRTRQAAGDAPGQWRGLEELVDTPEVREMLEREFPSGASLLSDPVGRRDFLRLMGASLALAGVAGCTAQPLEPIVPFVRQPETYVPGRPLFYATAMTHRGFANGLLVETHLGRPTKVEGNPDHPTSLRATDVLAQASILSLYDPDRSPTVTFEGRIRPWGAFVAAAQNAMRGHRRRNGLGLSLLTERVSSPTLIAQIRALLAELPQARWYQYEPVDRDNVRAGARLAFGEVVEAHYRLEAADVIVSFESDFLADEPDSLRLARRFAERRQPSPDRPVNRLYVVESTLSLTGARADHRLALGPGDIERVLRAVAGRLGIGTGVAGLAADLDRFAEVVARDLGAHPGSSLVMAGPAQPPVVHALVHALNQTLGNYGATVEYTDPVDEPNEDNRGLVDLLAEVDAGGVGTLVIMGANPVYSAPVDLQFAERVQTVELRIHLGTYADETAALCHWHVPEAHFLEAWSDARAFDGTATIVQPVIAPLYGGKSAHELLIALSSRTDRSAYDVVREYWREWFAKHSADSGPPPAETAPAAGVAPSPAPEPAAPPPVQPEPAPAAEAAASAGPQAPAPPVDPAFEGFWRRALHDGVVAGTDSPPRPMVAGTDWLAQAEVPPAGVPALQVLFRADPTIYDGRFANNGWLQELPKPLTKLAWDNAVLMGPRTAERMGISQRLSFRGGEHGELVVDVVELEYDGRTIRAPVLIAPGQADDCVTLHLGYGRTRGGRVSSGAGFNAFLVRTSTARWAGVGLQLRVTGDTYSLASTQSHHAMEGRDFVRGATVERFRQDPGALHEGHHAPPRTLTLYPEHPHDGAAWGMAIDLNACTGCSACIVACQAENNVPVVGKAQVLRGREMHWLRVDRYHQGGLDAPETLFQPVPCMHCENAPCEVVCPVGATSHSSEGLNEMVYNRCVGTRYCSNNCPYKVRRFNFLLYADWETPSLKPMRNPDVTVRSRGVMEKCTYCVQRINAARIDAKQEGRPIRDGEVVTACQAVCPADAIVFGDVNDASSRVAQLKADARHYALLADLNTRPRTTYLGRLRNPNPELEPASAPATSEL